MNERTRKTLGGIAVCASTVVLAFGCVEPVRDVGTEQVEEAGVGAAGFIPTGDAATDGADVFAPPNVEMCVATECPSPYATCPKLDGTLAFKCETNLFTDDANCGACGNACPGSNVFGELKMLSHCIDGTCQPACPSGIFDCNGLVDDGCESIVSTDPDNCGTCGNVCPELVNGIRACVGGKCNDECLSPKTWCSPSCVDILTDNSNCGACGNQCPYVEAPWGMTSTCANGQCGTLKCLALYDDCNHDLSDGCETSLSSDTQNCGACGNTCAPGQICTIRQEKGTTPVCACDPGETLCDGYSCADLLTDLDNCGACDNRCPRVAHGEAACQNGYCTSACSTGWGDCDGDPTNGCETDLSRNTRHCGACGNACDNGAGQPCIDGQCFMTACDAGVVTK